MNKRSEDTVKRTAAELRAKRERGETRVDWRAAAAKALPSGSDPDDAMEEIDWVATELPRPRRKEHTTLRLDADMLEWFRAQGRGYQTRINAILRSYFEQHTR
ncbi:MAG: BrnA antitoxin family protein [Bauldia sp.]|nr:MAG: BrnA antitoxin family protein [Bauldia sp.]MBZ0229035.1 BrnA antitoxin family protein [Bauldia sp.]